MNTRELSYPQQAAGYSTNRNNYREQFAGMSTDSMDQPTALTDGLILSSNVVKSQPAAFLRL